WSVRAPACAFLAASRTAGSSPPAPPASRPSRRRSKRKRRRSCSRGYHLPEMPGEAASAERKKAGAADPLSVLWAGVRATEKEGIGLSPGKSIVGPIEAGGPGGRVGTETEGGNRPAS